MNIKAYKTLNNQPHVNEALAKFIVRYCLNLTTNLEPHNVEMWCVGVSKGDNPKGKNYKSWECASHLEALQTKQYLVSEKHMIDDNNEINGDETLIYVYRD